MRRVLIRYSVGSVFRIGIITSLLASLMLMGVDLFTNLDTYMNYSIGFVKAAELTLLYFPEAFLLAMGPSFMFAVTYHLSMLHANNEIMSILNSGTSLSAVVRPVLVCAILLSFFYFGFNELVAIPASNRKAVQTELYTYAMNSSNSKDVALSDMQSGYMVYAGTYSDSEQTLYDVSLIESDEHGALVRRTDAYKATYDQTTGLWTLHDAYVYEKDGDSHLVVVEHESVLESTVIKLEPQLFRDVTNEISRMSLRLAGAYLARMRTLNPEQYASLGTEYYKRIFSCLTPLVMMIIACSMSYRFKKNILFISLICSISVAVVYFVVQMMTMMMADQGVIAPQLGTLVPFAAIIMVSLIINAFMRRQ